MLVAPAVERNKQPILDVLKQYYPQNFAGKILEISSGTGGHVIHFAQHFQYASFQPSELDPRSLHSIVAYIDHYQVRINDFASTFEVLARKCKSAVVHRC